MRKFIALLVVLAVVFVVWNRQRLFLRDPLGSVTRNGAKENGAQVYINYVDDALLENYNAPMYVMLVQHGDRMGTPAILHCIAYVACLLNADVATLLDGSEGGKVESMSSKAVEFRDANGREVVVALR